MRMTASWFRSLDLPDTRLWRELYRARKAGSPLIVIPTVPGHRAEAVKVGHAARLIVGLTALRRTGVSEARIGTKKRLSDRTRN